MCDYFHEIINFMEMQSILWDFNFILDIRFKWKTKLKYNANCETKPQ